MSNTNANGFPHTIILTALLASIIAFPACSDGLFDTRIVQPGAATTTPTTVTGLSNVLIESIGTVSGGTMSEHSGELRPLLVTGSNLLRRRASPATQP